MERQELPGGHTIVAEGAPGDRFYVLLSGLASVTQEGRGPRAMLRPGETFGEVALAMGVAAHGDRDDDGARRSSRAATARRSTSSSARSSPTT